MNQPPKGTRAEIRKAMKKRCRHVWGLWLQGWSQGRITKRIGITSSRVAQILNGHVRITRRGLSDVIEGNNWKAKRKLLPPLSDYQVRAK
jgi:hypothetical protein